MKFKHSLYFLILIVGLSLSSSPSIAKSPEKKSALKGTLRIYQVDKDHFRFESCDSEKKCESIGRDEGYTQKELEAWQKFRPNSALDIAPMIALVTAIALLVGAIVFFPATIVAGIAAIAVSGLTYFFTQTPQVQAGMPNAVYKEFEADPDLLPQFKSFLKEMDEGLVTSESNPRIFSGKTVKAQPEVKQAPSISPTDTNSSSEPPNINWAF